jgi:hypothetical protein
MIFAIAATLAVAPLDDSFDDAARFSGERANLAASLLEWVKVEDLLPSKDQGSSFDGERARRQADSSSPTATGPSYSRPSEPTSPSTASFQDPIDVDQRLWRRQEAKWERDYAPNEDLGDILGSLSVFDAIKKDLERSQSRDVRTARVFPGKAFTCSKSLAPKTMYDCCFSYGGMATKVGLSKCSADELQLRDLRSRGHCHYVGTHKERIARGLWKSREQSVFCCFASPIARVYQEGAREQLRLAWGDSRSPDCRGLSMGEIAQVNIEKLDVEQKLDKRGMEGQISSRLRRVQERLISTVEPKPRSQHE